MDKQKQIEEMAKVIDWDCNNKSMDYCDKVDDCNECRAIDLYNAGYRKIPENAVVLTQEEWAVHNEQLAQAMYQKEVNTRKETAEKFAERLKSRFEKSREYYTIDTGTAWGEGQIGGLINDKIDEICKELTEGKS